MIIGPCNKMVLESLKMKNKSHYYWDDIIYLEDFDVNLVKIVKRESRIDVVIYYFGYVVKKPGYNISSINPYLIVRRVIGYVERTPGTSDKYLVVANYNKEVLRAFDELWKFIGGKINVVINCDIEKSGQFYPEIYLDECLYETVIV